MQRKTVVQWLKGVTWVGIYGGLLMPLVFLPIIIFPFVFSKLLAFQVLIGLTFPAYLLLAWMEPKYRPKMHLLYGAVGAYFIALLLSVLFAVDPSRAWWGNQERMNGLFTLVHFFAWLTMAISLVRSERQWIRLMSYEVVLSVLMAIVAILQRPFPMLLLFKASDRVGGLLDNPIYMAAYQIFNLYFILWLWSKVKSANARILLAIAAGIDLVAFFFAQSRGAFIGLLVGLVIFLAIRGLLMKDRRARLATITGLVVVFAGYGLLFAARNTEFIANSSFHRLVSFDVGGTDTRLIAWKIAWQGFLEKPIFGWGLDNFHILFNQKYNPQSMRFSLAETWFDRSHNTVLDVLSMTGIVGAITFFAIFVVMALVLIRAYRKRQLDAHALAILLALPVAYFVQNLFVFDHPAAFSMSFLMYAFVIAITRAEFHDANAEEGTSEKTRGFSSGLAFALVCAALLLVWRGSVLPFRASESAILANNYFSASYIPEAHAAAREAANRPTMYLDEQTFLLVRNLVPLISSGSITSYKQYPELIEMTKNLLTEEIERHPKNAYTVYLAARFYQETGRLYPKDLAKTEAYYRQAIALSPMRQQFWYSLADFYQRTGRSAQSLEIQKQLLTFDPEQGQPYWSYGVTLAYNENKKSEGAEYMRKAMTAPYPYYFSDPREALQLVDALELLKDKEELKKVPTHLIPLSGNGALDPSTLPIYLEIAQRLDREGLPEVREQILAFAAKFVDPAARETYARGGVASTSTTKQQTTAVPAKTTSTPTPGSGPRR